MAIDTGKVTDRRTVRFQSLAEMRRDLDSLESAHKAGRLRTSGNWTPGQVFTHLASWINFAYDGYPPSMRPPWFIKFFIRMKKSKYLQEGMPSGVKIPRVPGGTVGADDVPFEEGITRLRAAVDRLDKSEPPLESPAFGPMNYDEKKQLNLRHAELHLSFLHP